MSLSLTTILQETDSEAHLPDGGGGGGACVVTGGGDGGIGGGVWGGAESGR